jgi:hypothetical protein
MKGPFFTLGLAGLLALQIAFAEDSAIAPMEFSKMSATPFSGRLENSTAAFAHLLGLKLGSTALAPDGSAVHPVTKKKTQIVGAITAFKWSGRPADSMELTFSMSDANFRRLENVLKQPVPTTALEFNFQIYSVDSETKEPFIRLKSFHYPFRGLLNKVGSEMLSKKAESLPLRGTLAKTAGRLSLDLNSSSSSAKIQVLPVGPSPQNLIVGTGSEQTRKIHWGH